MTLSRSCLRTTVQGRPNRIAARRRWVQPEEIGWVHSQEIRSVPSQEIGWANQRKFCTRRHGAITKADNVHARRILIEAAWNYRHQARISRVLEARQQGQLKAARDIAWKAQLRLAQRYKRLSFGWHLPQNKVCVAIARELAEFVWDVTRQVTIVA
jgi:hypothetical protein